MGDGKQRGNDILQISSYPSPHSFEVAVPGSICLQMMLQRKQRVEGIYLSLASICAKYYFVEEGLLLFRFYFRQSHWYDLVH